MESSSPTLFLIPTVLAENTLEVFPPYIKNALEQIDYYLVEELRTARRFLSLMKISKPIESLIFFQLNKDTSTESLKSFFKQVGTKNNIGVLSEAGCPGIADPGALAVEYAHKIGMKVKPMVGPSSILLALIGSGFNGQSFSFSGYLPIDKPLREKAIKTLEREAYNHSRTQIFMETPFRNNQMLQDIIRVCNPQTKLCIASNLTAIEEFIVTKKISEWKQSVPDLHKKPTIFLLSN